MDSKVVIYKSKYGRSRKYARWISEKLECKCMDSDEFDANDLELYDTIIYGAGIYAGVLNGIDWMNKFSEDIRDKNIIIFSCGITDPEDEEHRNKINKAIEKEIPECAKNTTKIFNFRGGIDYSRISLVDKAKITVIRKVLEKKEYATLTKEERNFAYEYNKNMEFTNKECISELVEYVNNIDECVEDIENETQETKE